MYQLIDPSTKTGLEELLANAITKHQTITVTGVRVLDDLARKRNRSDQQEVFECKLKLLSTDPDDFYIVATLPSHPGRVIRIEASRKGKLTGTVVVDGVQDTSP